MRAVEAHLSFFVHTPASLDVFLSGGNVMARGTAGMAPMSLPPARLATAGSGSFSAMMETAQVLTSFATATGTVTMAQMKTLCCVVGYVILSECSVNLPFTALFICDTSLICFLSDAPV